jgi:hypothetical protein
VAADLFMGGGTSVHGSGAGHQGRCRRRRRGKGAAVGQGHDAGSGVQRRRCCTGAGCRGGEATVEGLAR